MNEDILSLAKECGFYYHDEYEYASFAEWGRSVRPKGFKYGLEEIP